MSDTTHAKPWPRHVITRRASLAVASVAATAATVAPASAATSYARGNYPRTPILSGYDRHLVSRFSYGLTPSLARQVKRAGGAAQWFEAQLKPGNVPERKKADGLRGWFPRLDVDPAQAWNGGDGAGKYGWDLNRWTMLRQIYSNRQVHERMVEFFTDRLYVPALGWNEFTWRSRYDAVIRQHALGRFDRMLVATVLHPAMSLFLDQWTSAPDSPAENLPREMLELHTLGVGHYTEDDVKGVAVALTGYTVDAYKTWLPGYDPSRHATGPIDVAGFHHENADPDGRACAIAMLRYLARHRSTAENVCRDLAVKFVSDNPSDGLVHHLADVYQSHGTSIPPVLRALVRHREFKAAANRKLLTPSEDLVSAIRALRVDIKKPTYDLACANYLYFTAENLGGAPYTWPRPDGKSAKNSAWDSPARAIASFNTHWDLAWGQPAGDVSYLTKDQWVPGKSIVFRDLVDHLCRSLLGRRSTSKILQACCQATGVKPGARITSSHWLLTSRESFPRLIATILDTPQFFVH